MIVLATAVESVLTFARDAYHALREVPAEISSLVDRVSDEAGWVLGVESSGRYGRRSYTFEARNIAIYGYSLAPQPLALVQVRRYLQNRYGKSVRKSYALVGVDEGDQLFAHVLPSSPLQWSGIGTMSPEQAIQKAESVIFRVPVAKLDTIIRQGDIAIVPVRAIPSAASPVEPGTALHEWTLANSHDLTVDGDLYQHGDDLYVDGLVEIDHSKGQHHPVDYAGKARIVIGSAGNEPWWLTGSFAYGD